MTAPLCPRDATPLTPTKDVFGPGTKAHVCGKCTGVLVDWDTGQKFFTSLGLSLSDLQSMVAQSAGRKPQGGVAPVSCTSCGKGQMKALVHKGIELDLCEACGAAWFDRGELKRITGGKLGGGLEAKAQPVAGETSKTVGVFEMFWDCAYCDAKALLGKSNKFCPQCGAQQDANRRYFPPPGQEVAANHEYDGADKSCPACQTPNGAKANNCRSCGSPLDGAVEVNRVADRSSAAPRPGAAAANKKSKWPWVVGGVILALLAFCLVSMFWTKDVGVTVTSHSWERTIDIERMTAVSESAWCDSMPSGAYGVSRSREQRSTKSIPDGETCTTRDVDRGDGTFERKQECRTKYREEPIYDDRCRFTIDRWKVSRTAKAAGQGLEPAPNWPPVNLSRTGNSLGSEREGSRNEKYTLSLMGDDKKPYTCTVPSAKWTGVPDGHKKVIPIGVITGAAECDKL